LVSIGPVVLDERIEMLTFTNDDERKVMKIPLITFSVLQVR
jgi:hypothetical protein